MINNLIDAISVKLNQVFGDGYRIYSDDVKQGLIEPCFFIALLKSSQTQIVGKRSSREYQLDIHYFPEAVTNNIEMMDVADKLMVEVETVIMLNGDLVRGFNIHYEMVDGVLHFFITYKMIVLITDVDANEKMENLTVSFDA